MLVLCVVTYPKINNPVVGFVTVNVVQITCRPLAIVKRPDNPVRSILTAIMSDNNVSGCAFAASNVPRTPAAVVLFPNQHPKIRII
jgi:hypothetical protein